MIQDFLFLPCFRRHLILSCQGRLNIFPFDDPLCSFAIESSEYYYPPYKFPPSYIKICLAWETKYYISVLKSIPNAFEIRSYIYEKQNILIYWDFGKLKIFHFQKVIIYERHRKGSVGYYWFTVWLTRDNK